VTEYVSRLPKEAREKRKLSTAKRKNEINVSDIAD